MRRLIALGLLINSMVFTTAHATEVNRLEFIYFKPINRFDKTDFDNPVNIVKYHGVYDTTYTPTYTGLFTPYEPIKTLVLTLADNHESLGLKYDNNTAGQFANAQITPLQNGDYIVSHEQLPVSSTQKPLLDKRYIKTFDISGKFLRTEVDGKPATLATSFSNFHALPEILYFPKGSKCYQWQYHESSPEFYKLYRSELLSISDEGMAQYLQDKNPSEFAGENNQVAIYSTKEDGYLYSDYELSFYYMTIYDELYFDEGIKFTPKNAMPIDGTTCTYLNPIASDYIEKLLKENKEKIIK